MLTCGMVNGRKIQVRPVVKPPWAEKMPDNHAESADEDNPTETERSSDHLSKEQLRELRSQLGWPHFKDVFMLSSIDGDDVETLKVQDINELSQIQGLYFNAELTPDLCFSVSWLRRRTSLLKPKWGRGSTTVRS